MDNTVMEAEDGGEADVTRMDITAELNNIGVVLLKERQYDDAMMYFRTALVQVRNEDATAALRGRGQQHQPADVQAQERFQNLMVLVRRGREQVNRIQHRQRQRHYEIATTQGYQQQPTHEQHPPTNNDNNPQQRRQQEPLTSFGFYVYNRAISIIPLANNSRSNNNNDDDPVQPIENNDNNNNFDNDEPSRTYRASEIILFNIGLVYDNQERYGSDSNNSRGEYGRNALNFYRLSLQLVSREFHNNNNNNNNNAEPPEGDNENQELQQQRQQMIAIERGLLLIVLLNNISRIYYELGATNYQFSTMYLTEQARIMLDLSPIMQSHMFTLLTTNIIDTATVTADNQPTIINNNSNNSPHNNNDVMVVNNVDINNGDYGNFENEDDNMIDSDNHNANNDNNDNNNSAAILTMSRMELTTNDWGEMFSNTVFFVQEPTASAAA